MNPRALSLFAPVQAMSLALLFGSVSLPVLHAADSAATPPAPAPAPATLAPPNFGWWRDGRFGMFIHWGPSSLTGKEISWSREKYGKENYDALHKEFNPVRFDAAAWVATARAAGMRYMVLTAKHHDGFMLWDTRTDPYNIMNTPFGRDVVAELSAAARAADLPFCVYFSPGDWRDPDCRDPQGNPRFVERMHAQLTELLTRYGRIPLVWFDFDGWPNPSDPRETATLVRGLQPGILLTNRLEAIHSDESHGRVGPWGDYATPEQFVGAYCEAVPWESCMTIGSQWSWRTDEKIKTLRQCLESLVRTVAGDGNLLFNVGPRADGEIEPAQVARLHEMGSWLRTNGEAVYGTRGGPYLPTRDYGATRTAQAVYVHVFANTPARLVLPALPLPVRSATRLDGSPISFSQTDASLVLEVTEASRDPSVTVIKLALAGNPLALAPIQPPSASGSLAYRRPAAASSSIAPLCLHGAESAFDDDDSTYWTPGRDEAVAAAMVGREFPRLQSLPEHRAFRHGGWLSVDLGRTTRVTRAVLREKVRTHYRPITAWTIECADIETGPWREVTAGKTVGASLAVEFPAPAEARFFRLTVSGIGRPALAEFQLFQP